MLFVLGVLNVTLPFPTQNLTTEESQGITRPFMLLKKVLQSVRSSLQDTPVVEAQEAQEAQALLWTIYAVLFLHVPPLHLLDTFLEAIQEATVGGSSLLGVLFPY
jgi:hypothetical protein